MKALSIRQPFAWLIVNGIKDIENRKWRTNYRGPLLIHASKAWDQEGYEFAYFVVGEKAPEKSYHHFGMILGVVDMVDCVEQHPSKWFSGPWGFVFENPRRIHPPIVYKGRLGLFDIPDEIGDVIIS